MSHCYKHIVPDGTFNKINHLKVLSFNRIPAYLINQASIVSSELHSSDLIVAQITKADSEPQSGDLFVE